VRAGGKHNDLENVGYTARHHTFFEMLGNFSFGDYFKEQAIELAWNLLHQGVRPAQGTPAGHRVQRGRGGGRLLAQDHRLLQLEDHPHPTSDNFWAMGDTGPCGPARRSSSTTATSIPGGPPGSPDQDGDRFIEIWNLVFMQFEQLTKDERVNLPKPSIDTGMGLERIAAVLQGKHNNYDIDLFRTLIEAVAHETGVDPDGPQVGVAQGDRRPSAHHVVPDRRRRAALERGPRLRAASHHAPAMRHAHILGAQEPMVFKLVPSLVHEMGDAYPELVRAQPLITETLKLEEGRFKKTLGTGLKLLEDETKGLSAGGTLKGDVAFQALRHVRLPARPDTGRSARPRHRSGHGRLREGDGRAARQGARGVGRLGRDRRPGDLVRCAPEGGATEFLGYDTERAEGQIKAIVVDGKEVAALKAGETGWIVTNQTPFYAESGGQLGDNGRFVGANGEAAVLDVQKRVGDLHAHHAKVEKGELKVGDDLAMSVDPIRRAQLRAHHSATHLLHEALRRHLGEHVTQKGSLVAPDRLRFDISHTKAISLEELRKIEDEVNERIRKNSTVGHRLMTPEEAIAAGAMALFGEKYGEEVRVLSMGGEDGQKYSVELCGGTHALRTGDIGLFRIVGEGAVAAGVRRIEAVAGAAAEDHVRHQAQLLPMRRQS
jgi:alanyl-tRNA synthetase